MDFQHIKAYLLGERASSTADQSDLSNKLSWVVRSITTNVCHIDELSGRCSSWSASHWNDSQSCAIGSSSRSRRLDVEWLEVYIVVSGCHKGVIQPVDS